ncbi:hypothetical protein GCM10020000_04800 [Streptomyces olivoverticillatus]
MSAQAPSQWKGIAVATEHRDAGDTATQFRGHLLARLDGNHMRATVVQEGGGHARPCPDINDLRARQRAADEFLQDVQESRRVRRPVVRVLSRGRIERPSARRPGGPDSSTRTRGIRR